MANTKISAFTDGVGLVGGDEFAIARSGANRKINTTQLLQVILPEVLQPANSETYTYTYTTSPHASYPDSSFLKLKDGVVDINTSSGVSAQTSPEFWAVHSTLFGFLTSIGPPGGYTPPSYANTWGIMWQNADPLVVFDLASAKLPRRIAIWSQGKISAGVRPALSLRVRSADNSGMSTNVATPLNIPYGITFTDSRSHLTVLYIPTDATARRYWELLFGRAGEWTPVNEVGFYLT